MKIQKLTLKNFRGVLGPVTLQLTNGCSLLLYGDNGTGKSSFADAIEWFITDEVSHLSGEEIPIKHDGLKNTLAASSEISFVELECSADKKNTKNLILHKEKLKAEFKDPEKIYFIDEIKNERLWIRNRDLTTFIVSRKGDRLADISGIIGFDEVTKTKATFKKSANDLKTLIKNRGFEAQIAQKRSLILSRLSAAVHSEEQFYQAVHEQIKPFNLNIEVVDKKTFDQVENLLKSGIDQKRLAERQSLEGVSKTISEELEKLPAIEVRIETLQKNLINIQKNKETIKGITLSKLLDEAARILKNHEKDECPLCLQTIERSSLTQLIAARLEQLKQIQNEASSVSQDKNSCLEDLRDIFQNIRRIAETIKTLGSSRLNHQPISEKLQTIEFIGKELKPDFLEVNTGKIIFDRNPIVRDLTDIKSSIDTILNETKEDDVSKKIDLSGRIAVSKEAFFEMARLEKERTVLEDQREVIEKIYSDFSTLQRQEMTHFLDAISKNVNDYYLFMNDGEKVDSIELVTVDKDEEFVGIAFKLKFHGQEVHSPKKYLSESHLNCIGLCFFLASVKLFNNKSKFFILDDVISSFDKNHRLRFGQLLLEKFSDYQVLILTHESDWFDLMSSQVRGLSWKINKTSWDVKNGTSLNLSSLEITKQIEEQIASDSEQGLGNLLRKYAERLLKELSNDLNAEFPFRFNERNEIRTLDELFSNFIKRLKSKSDLKDNDIVKRLSVSQFITNRTSHDSGFKENINDLKAVYNDLNEFESLFLRVDCKKKVSLENLNRAKKVISCKCGKKEINWSPS